MILLDTHIWIWWIHGDDRLTKEYTDLLQPFHRDPADQIIVATARFHGCQLMTLDGKIRDYPHVELLPTNTSNR